MIRMAHLRSSIQATRRLGFGHPGLAPVDDRVIADNLNGLVGGGMNFHRDCLLVAASINWVLFSTRPAEWPSLS
jgi:hypothetical protein